MFGFNIVGYGCMICIGNFGLFVDEIVVVVGEGDFVVCLVFLGNCNFEVCIYFEVKVNYFVLLLFVVVYSFAGRMDIDW